MVFAIFNLKFSHQPEISKKGELSAFHWIMKNTYQASRFYPPKPQRRELKVINEEHFWRDQRACKLNIDNIGQFRSSATFSWTDSIAMLLDR